MTVSELQSSSESALLCTSESLYLSFDFVLYFSSVSVFVLLYDLYVVSRKENIQIIREIFNDKSIRHREVYSKFYLRGER